MNQEFIINKFEGEWWQRDSIFINESYWILIKMPYSKPKYEKEFYSYNILAGVRKEMKVP